MKSRENKKKKDNYDPFAPRPADKEAFKNAYRWLFAVADSQKAVREERGEKLPKPKRRLLEMETNGSFLYNGKGVNFNDPEALYAKVLRAIFRNQNPKGYAPYTAINSSIELEGAEKILDKKEASTRIRNSIAELFRRTDLPETIPTGELLLEPQRGKGIILRNPEIE